VQQLIASVVCDRPSEAHVKAVREVKSKVKLKKSKKRVKKQEEIEGKPFKFVTRIHRIMSR
jgi:hypothetical protein